MRKKRVLMICHSSNMLFAALQITRYDLTDSLVDIIISDYSAGMKETALRLRKTNIFNHVSFAIISQKYQGKKLWHRIRKLFYVLDNAETVKKVYGLTDLNYDKLFFCNFDIPSYQLYHTIHKNNPDLELHRFEEGYSTYIVEDNYRELHKIMHYICKGWRIPTLNEATRFLHLFNTDLLMYSCNYELCQINRLSKDDPDLVQLLNSIYNYKDEAAEYKNKKYIFFEESFFIDQKENINDFQLIQNIANLVGNENLIIKLHPRNKINRFEMTNIAVAESTIPWEIIQMNENFDNKILLTISSGSVLPTLTWLKCSARIYLLYLCLDRKPVLVNTNYEKYIKQLCQSCDKNQIRLIKSIEEVTRDSYE